MTAGMRNGASHAKWPPGGLTGWLVRRAVAPGADPAVPDSRLALGELEGRVSTMISVSLAASKAVLGWLSGSLSLMADAANNSADILSSLIVLFSFRVSRRPRDRRHPFGHGRAETLATLALAAFLVAVAVEVARAGVRRVLHPEPVEAPWWLTVTVLLTVAAKAWLARFARRLARASRSQVLEADAWNHTCDIACTSLALLALAASGAGWLRLDGVAALGVSGFIAVIGVRYGREAIDTLLGKAPSHAELDRIRGIAGGVEGVRGVHDVIIHDYGDVKLLSLHVEVDADLTVLDAHALAERVEEVVGVATGSKATVHVDPVDRRHPRYAETACAMEALVSGEAELVGYHDLRLFGTPQGARVAVDLVARASVPAAGFGRILERARERLHEALPWADPVDVGIETEYASEPERRRVFERRPASRAETKP